MPQRFTGGKTLKKTVRLINLGSGLKKGGQIGAGGGTLIALTKVFSAKSDAEAMAGLQFAIGACIGGLTLGFAGQAMEKRTMLRLIGRPRICKRIASDIRDKNSRLFVRALGNIDYSNESIRDALNAVLVTKDATQMERNIVQRQMQSAIKKAETQEVLAGIEPI